MENRRGLWQKGGGYQVGGVSGVKKAKIGCQKNPRNAEVQNSPEKNLSQGG